MSNKLGKSFLLVVMLGAGLAAIVFATSAAKVTLVADGPLPVYDRTTAVADRVLIGTLNAGAEVHVTDCIDLKHYIVPEVLMESGRKGYVIEGMFHLRRESPFSAAKAPTSWRC
jgi:hypothetical protein